VLLAAAVSSMGAFAFGYHLGILNGPLAEMSAQLGFAGNPQLSGLVRALALQLDGYSTHLSGQATASRHRAQPARQRVMCQRAPEGRTHHGCVLTSHTPP